MAIEFGGQDTATTNVNTVVAHATPGTIGAYTELIASTARQSYLVTVTINGSSVDSNYELFIAVGAAGVEVNQFSLGYWGNAALCRAGVTFPFTIASGVRVSMACKSTDSSAACRPTIALSDDNSYGTSTELTMLGQSGGQGTAIDPGVSANTKGAYVELVASTSHDMDFLVVCMGQNDNAAVGTQTNSLVDVALGAAASEVVLVGDIFHVMGTSEDGNTWYPIYAPIPSGSRVAVRSQSNSTDATDRLIDVSVLGVNITAPSGGSGIIKQAGPGGGMVA